jgi:acetoin utilization deacetylase AcuC-like enzyme
MATGLITHPSYLEHQTGQGHPERPERLMAIAQHLAKTGLQKEMIQIEPAARPDLSDWITTVHTPTYYRTLQSRLPKQGTVYLDPDTPYSPLSLAAAEMAVCGLLSAADGVMDGTFRNAFCAVRPPGHHAEADRSMGFCMINNVAVCARYLQQKYALARIMIVDWDVHHGNGTQHLFYNDPTVFYFSTHQFPFYPGTGSARERGEGEGEGTTLNCPLQAESGDGEILKYFESDLADAAAQFRPDFILVSAGFDAHRDDPLAHLEVTEEGFGEMTRIVLSLASTYCSGRVVSCLEGGYNLAALARSVAQHLEVLQAE